MEISVERYHYPIGQGIFSAQIIRAKEDDVEKEKYVCVYDCGSTTSKVGKSNVEKFAKELYEKSSGIINMLVISHLDDDHVNGVRELYKEGFQINKVVLPYMTRWEQVLYVFSRTEDISSAEYLLSNKMEFYNFIINNSRSNENDDEIPLEVSSDTVVVFSDIEISREFVQFVGTPLGDISWEFVYFSLYSGRGDIFESNVIDDFAAKARENYGGKEEFPSEKTFSREELRNLRNIYNEVYASHRKNSNENCKVLTSNRSSIILYSGLERSSYGVCMGLSRYVGLGYAWGYMKYVTCKWIAGGILCTCHLGASSDLMGLNHGDCCKDYSACNNFEYHNVYENLSYENSALCHKGELPVTGWLGTGDAELHVADNCWELVRKLGAWRLSHVRELTVPHHGSKNGSSSFFFSLFNAENKIICIIHSQISGGYVKGNKVVHGKYGHPHKEVCANIWNAENLTPVHVTEDIRTKYQSTTCIDIS